MSRELIERAAFHEAGHIVIARFFGHTCNFTECSTRIPGEGKSEIKWSGNLPLINSILHYPLFASDLSSMRGKIDLEWLESFRNHYIMTYAAGTAAEANYDIARGNLPPNAINAADGEAIGTFIKGTKLLGLSEDPAVVNHDFQICIGFLKKEKYAAAVNGLAALIIAKANLRLECGEIDGYFSTIQFDS